MSKLAVLLLSGGLDSTTVASVAVQGGYRLTALTLDYGQTHRRELESAAQVAAALQIRQRVVEVRFYKELAWYSALTRPDELALPVDRPAEDMAADIPSSYVPLRNTFFMTLAAALLESEALAVIERDGVNPADLSATLFIAANALDYSGYPDCRPEYYAVLAETLRRGSKLGMQYGVPFQIETPLIALSKAEIVRLAVANGAPLQHAWSCYRGGDRPCGHCDSCLLRARGFAEAGVPDPALGPA